MIEDIAVPCILMNVRGMTGADYGLREASLSWGQSSDLTGVQGGPVMRKTGLQGQSFTSGLYFSNSSSVFDQFEF